MTTLSRIQFSILPSETIVKYSVVEITSTKTHGQNTIHDERMGILQNGKRCLTCGCNNIDCPGHFGHINLATPIIHPLMHKHLLHILTCICHACSKIIVSRNILEFKGILSLQKHTRFEAVLALAKRVCICWNCDNLHPTYQIQDDRFYMYYKDKTNRAIITPEEIHNILAPVSNEDWRTLGIDPRFNHPKDIIMTAFPILPLTARPYILSGTKQCDDDLTYKYLEIVKNNLRLKDSNITEQARQEKVRNLEFHIKTLMDNSSKKAKQTNRRPMKCIKQRISGKAGLIRNNLMGKRVDFSARTVIGGDPSLDLDEIGIPTMVAQKLTFPERVTPMNYHLLNDQVIKRHAHTVIKNAGKYNEQLINLEYARKLPRLKMGDVVERPLRDGDWVLFNRQPTLHAASMIAMKTKVLPGKTFRMNLSITPGFNADFDGDEMNVHAPQSLESIAELRELSCVERHMISPQSNAPVHGIIQDALIGAYLLTRSDEPVRREDFFDACLASDTDTLIFETQQRAKTLWLSNHEKYREYLSYTSGKWHVKQRYLWTGRIMFSTLFPSDFEYTRRTDLSKVEIHCGILTSGVMCKKTLGLKGNSIIHVLWKYHSPTQAKLFISRLQRMINLWLSRTGHSIGIGDCIAPQSARDNVALTIAKAEIEAEAIHQSEKNPILRELKVTAALNKAKDVGQKIALDQLEKDNQFKAMVMAGSKGNFVNIAQVIALVGQQNVIGKRIPFAFQARTLPHFCKYDNSPAAKGFVKRSYMDGLDPAEFWFHACSGRQGIIDTACKTADTGYMQRKMVKAMEDLKVHYDGTVRNATGRVIQFDYGEDGLGGSFMVPLKERTSFCDVSKVVERLNSVYEMTNISR